MLIFHTLQIFLLTIPVCIIQKLKSEWSTFMYFITCTNYNGNSTELSSLLTSVKKYYWYSMLISVF